MSTQKYLEQEGVPLPSPHYLDAREAMLSIRNVLLPLTRLEDNEVTLRRCMTSYGYVEEQDRTESFLVTVFLKKEDGKASWFVRNRSVVGEARYHLVFLPDGRILLADGTNRCIEFKSIVNGRSAKERCLLHVSEGLLRLAGKSA